jgi:hypothetical protein
MKHNIEIAKYNKDKNGKVKSIEIFADKIEDHSIYENLSNKLDCIVYVVPKGVNISFDNNGWLVKATGENTENIWQYIKGWPMPYECFINGFPFPTRMEELWKSNIPVETINIDELRWSLEISWWTSDDEIPYDLKPGDVLRNIEKFPLHLKRINDAETKYPLSLVQTKQNRWLIYDGVHRFLKELLENKQTVQVQKFSINEVGAFVRESHLELFEEWKVLKYF